MKKKSRAKKIIKIAALSLSGLILVTLITAGFILYGRIASMMSIKHVGDDLYTMNFQQDYHLDKALAAGIKNDEELLRFVCDDMFFGYQVDGNFSKYGCSAFITPTPDGKYLAGMCCFLGHIFPVYFGFKGGKGVVTVAALLAVINPIIFGIAVATFLVMFLCTKIVSISSIVSGVVIIISTFFVTYFYNYKAAGKVPFEYVVTVTIMTFVICGSVIAKHHANIVRLIHGEEKKLTLKKKTPKGENS